MNRAKEETDQYNRLAVGFTVGAVALAAGTTALFFISRSDEQLEPDSGPEIPVFPNGVSF